MCQVQAPNKDKIPDKFKTPEEAGEFGDVHSAADYWDEMEEEEFEFNIHERRYEIPVDEQIYQIAKQRAEKQHCSVGDIINTELRQALGG